MPDSTISAGKSAASAAARVQFEYHAAYNAIIEPDKYVACTRYFIRRWMPLLGENGTRIVLALRSLGYYNRETGETRDGIEIDLPELASLIGISVPTLKREFGYRKGQEGVKQNPVLHKFVTKDRQYWRDPVTNRLLRTANVYRVKMDDPVHEDDLPRLNDLLQEKGKEAPKAQNEPKPPKGVASKAQNEPKVNEPQASKAQCESKKSQVAPENEQSESKTEQSESNGNQNEPTLIDFSELPKRTSYSSPTPAAPGDSLSLFSEQTKPKRDAWREAWSAMSSDQQQPWHRKAEVFLKAQGIDRPGVMATLSQAKGLFREEFARKNAEENCQ